MAELQSFSAVLKPTSSAISSMDRRSSPFFEQPMSDSQVERQDASTTLQSGSPGPPFKRAKWEELHSDTTFTRLQAGTTLPTITTNVGIFASQLPTSTYQSRAPAPPAQSSVYIGQLPSPLPQQLTGMPSTPSNTTPVSGCASPVPRNTTLELLNSNGRTAEILAELEKERQKNAELLDRIASLEARLEEREKAGVEGGDRATGAICGGSLLNGLKRSKKHKRMDRRVESQEPHLKQSQLRGAGIKQEEVAQMHQCVETEEQDVKMNELRGDRIKREEGTQVVENDIRDGFNIQGSAVTWMSREEVQLPDLEGSAGRGADSERDEFMESDYTDDDCSSSEEEEDDDYDENNDDDMPMKDTERRETKRNSERDLSIGAQLTICDANRKTFDVQNLHEGDHCLMATTNSVIGRDHGEDVRLDEKRTKSIKKRRRERKRKDAHNTITPEKRGLGYEIVPYKVHGMMSSYKKAPKTAFCPKEVKRIMESGVLALKNAQSHTMRKIIVFASLAIRHGCEDLYELDFNHFSVMKRGEPYVSPKDPGEHVLYDHPGIRKRIFYPNKQNPVLCPVCILDEERSMRPPGPSCPSCLFLCIKYGGRTRNLPQNEYVRQRMGRNKLKSFGPLLCQMALLVHIRTGSFFFKALGITLLFMAGFPDDLVRKETKYRNLDLLQKYYRSDEDAEGELLFHPYPPFYPQAFVAPAAVPAKVAAAGNRTTGKKQPPPLISKPFGSQAAGPLYLPPITARPVQGSPFSPFPSMAGVGPCPLPAVGNVTSSPGVTCAVNSGAATSGTPSPLFPPPYGLFSAYPVQCPLGGAFPPTAFWPPVSSFSPGPFPPPSYGYRQAFSNAAQYGLAPYYGNPFLSFPPTTNRSSDKNDDTLEESDKDSESSSSEASRKAETENV